VVEEFCSAGSFFQGAFGWNRILNKMTTIAIAATIVLFN